MFLSYKVILINYVGMPQRMLSTSLASANLKALRLFRYICRILPFIIKVHEVYIFTYFKGIIDLMYYMLKDTWLMHSDRTQQ